MWTLIWLGCTLQLAASAVTTLRPQVDLVSPEAINKLQYVQNPSKVSKSLVQTTVEQVESLIQQDPSLPRLTRGEILDILDNITKKDLKDLQSANSNREEKAIMLVMPYTTSNADDIKELYTKPPITQIVNDPLKQSDETEYRPVKRRRPTLPPVMPSIEETVKTTTQTESPRSSSTSAPTKKFSSKRKPDNAPVKVHQENKTKFNNKMKPIPSVTTFAPLPNQGLNVIDPPKLNLPPLQPYEGYYRPFSTHVDDTVGSDSIFETISLPGNTKHELKNSDVFIPESERPKYSSHYDGDAINWNHTSSVSSSTTTDMPDISNLADSLQPGMKDLLMSFGLLPDSKGKPSPTVVSPSQPNRHPAQVKPESYVKFKPLPDTAPTRDDMESFLAEFGLGKPENYRQMKKLPDTKITSPLPQIDPGMLPSSLQEVLENLGFENRQSKKISTALEKNQYVFNPMEGQQYASKDELKKLSQLMDIIKQINGTEEHLRKVNMSNLHDLIGSLNSDKFVSLDNQTGAPDPINYDYSLDKNQVKREENTTEKEIKNATSTVEEDSTLSIKEEIKNTTSTVEEESTPNIKDLEDSFGGSSDSSTVAVETEPPPAPKRTGFYYLLDWNTFLDIDDQKGKRVNLRFQPKVGDSSRFLSVTVP